MIQDTCQEGYGIFYIKADADLSRVKISDTDKLLRIQYELPPQFKIQ